MAWVWGCSSPSNPSLSLISSSPVQLVHITGAHSTAGDPPQSNTRLERALAANLSPHRLLRPHLDVEPSAMSRPVVGTSLASCCAVLSVFGACILGTLGFCFDAGVSRVPLDLHDDLPPS